MSVNQTIPNNLLFTYLPHYSDITKQNIGNTSNYTTTTEDNNQSNRPIGKIIGRDYHRNNLPDDLNSVIDVNYPHTTPSLLIKNNIEKINNGLINIGDELCISSWIKINRFPTKLLTNPNKTVTKKRVTTVSMEFGDNYSIEFGVMGPHYIYDNESIYKSVFEPISFTFTFLSDKLNPSQDKTCFSLYTDYSYNLNTWYFITLSLTNNNSTLSPKIFVNNIQQKYALYYGKIISNHGRGGGSELGDKLKIKPLRYDRNPLSARAKSFVAAGPNFIARYGNIIPSYYSDNEYIYRRIPFNPLNLKYVSFSPIYNYGMTVTNKKITGIDTGIDFGQFYIYKSYDEKLYDTHKHFYV